MKTSSTLIYCAIITFCFGVQTTLAQITSNSVNQTITLASGSSTFDINNDGTNDYSFEIVELTPGIFAARVNSLYGSQVLDNSTFGYPDPLNFGDSITGAFGIGNGSGNAVLGTDVGGGGQFSGLGVRYLGLKIAGASQYHYGWMELECVGTNDTIFLHAYGFNTTGDVSITAGEASTATSISESALTSMEFAVYPNPCVDVLTLDAQNFDANGSYSILNTAGELIREGLLETRIAVSDLATGLYFIRVSDANSVGQKTFVVR